MGWSAEHLHTYSGNISNSVRHIVGYSNYIFTQEAPLSHVPTVKWRDMTKYIQAQADAAAAAAAAIAKDSSDGATENLKLETEKPSSAVDVDDPVDPDEEDHGSDSEIDSDYDEVLDEEANRTDSFSVGIPVDLTVPALLDVLSDEAHTQKITEKRDPRKSSLAATGRSNKPATVTPIKDSEWDRWL